MSEGAGRLGRGKRPFLALPCRDIATMDEQGFCKIVGRSKDMIIRGGENIYPTELEDFLHTHPKVQEVQVRPPGQGGPGSRSHPWGWRGLRPVCDPGRWWE